MKKKHFKGNKSVELDHPGDSQGIEQPYGESDSEVDKLEMLLKEKTVEAEENYNKFLRSRADFDNFRKRAEREKRELADYAQEKLIKELLDVIDNVEIAISHISNETDVNSLREGITLISDQLLTLLKKFGVEQVSTIGDRFDPNICDAVIHEEADGCEPETVIKEFKKGYLLKGRLLRPAMVVVSKSPD